MTTAPRCCAALLTVCALAACTTTREGTASPAGEHLQAALAVDLPGFAPADAPPPPRELCTTGSGTGDGPRLDPALGEPTAAGYRSGDAELHAYAWTTSSPVAEAVLTQAAAEAPDCEYSLLYDSDTDGDGQIDAGGEIVQTAGRWAGSGWTGVAVTTEVTGQRSELRETRLVHSDAIVVLVVLRDSTGGPDAAAVADDFLRGVADNLD